MRSMALSMLIGNRPAHSLSHATKPWFAELKMECKLSSWSKDGPANEYDEMDIKTAPPLSLLSLQ